MCSSPPPPLITTFSVVEKVQILLNVCDTSASKSVFKGDTRIRCRFEDLQTISREFFFFLTSRFLLKQLATKSYYFYLFCRLMPPLNRFSDPELPSLTMSSSSGSHHIYSVNSKCLAFSQISELKPWIASVNLFSRRNTKNFVSSHKFNLEKVLNLPKRNQYTFSLLRENLLW